MVIFLTKYFVVPLLNANVNDIHQSCQKRKVMMDMFDVIRTQKKNNDIFQDNFIADKR